MLRTDRCPQPLLSHLSQRIVLGVSIVLAMSILPYLPAASCATASTNGKKIYGKEVLFYDLAPDSRGGEGYKLVYLVQVPIEVYWKFKTDFDNDLLVGNKYIREHRFISRRDNKILTDDKYTFGPDVFFRWQTEVFPEFHRLDFMLLNPEQSGQRFHYGYIQLEAVDQVTKVTQVAYFDFFGASFWANYPWGGGMKDFLQYTANWEQELILQLKKRYVDQPGK